MDVSKKNNLAENREFEPGKIRVLIGLGNPGKTYQTTYHNAGFEALDYLSGELSEEDWRKNKNFIFFKSGKIILIKPSVFMNDSGQAVKQALTYFKVKPENVVLIHDDSDIEAGNFKISFGRGAAGHRGVSSVINALKTKNFWRIRLGVRNRPGKAEVFILKKISRTDSEKLRSVFVEIKKFLFKDLI